MAAATRFATMHRLGLTGLLAGALAACTAPSKTPSEPEPQPAVEVTAAVSAPAAPADLADGDPAPVPCPEPKPGETRWLDSNPGAPLMVTYPNAMHPVPVACCAPWAKPGSRWYTIDPQGAVVGEVEVVSSDEYDVTGCAEPQVERRSGKAGVGVLASVGGHWKGARSKAWTPDAKQRAGLVDLIERVDGLIDDHEPMTYDGVEPVLPMAERTIYFEMPMSLGSHKDDDLRFAVVGGQLLVIAHLNEAGRWVFDHLEQDFTHMNWPNAYRPLAVLDLDGDNTLEIIVHRSAGTSWDHVVIGRSANHERKWMERARSVGGATI